MKTVKQILEARRPDTVVMTFGRMQPPTAGHELLVTAVVNLAKKQNADHVVYLSRSQDAKKNPLTVDQKVYYARKSFPGVNIVGATDQIRTFIEVAKSLTGKYKNLVMVAGSDRVPEYKTLLDRYNGKDFKFDNIMVVSAGERDPDADGAAGMSATKLRNAAAAGNFNLFKQGLAPRLPLADAKELFDDLRTGMAVSESTWNARDDYVNERLFNVGDIVIHEGEERIVTHRGANHIVLDNTHKSWLTDAQPTGRVDEATIERQQDKVRAARIIGLSLGYADADTKNDPTQIINSALRGMRNKALNAESKAIVSRMLTMAQSMGIKYDERLLPVSEGVDSGVYKGHGTFNSGSASTGDGEKQAHNLMHRPGGAQQSEYERRRKIQLKMHEGDENEDDFDEDDFDEDDFEDLHKEISDDDIIEHGYDDDEFVVVDDETGEVVEQFVCGSELNEVLSRVERIRAAQRMRRSSNKRERALRIALHRRSSGEKLAKRARRVAVKALEMKIARKPLSQLSVQEKERIERRVQMMKPAIARIAMKMMPRVRAVEKSRLESARTQG